jgi:hypothetical protein
LPIGAAILASRRAYQLTYRRQRKPIQSQLLKAETADREVRSTTYQLKVVPFPNYRDLAGFHFTSSEVNEALSRQLYRASSWKTLTTFS